MRRIKSTPTICFGLVLLAIPASVVAQTQPTSRKPDKSQAYYHFALGHVYAELAGAYGNRGDYLSKAIENYKLAMKEDPSASFLSEELSDLYIQAGRIREAVTDAEEVLEAEPERHRRTAAARADLHAHDRRSAAGTDRREDAAEGNRAVPEDLRIGARRRRYLADARPAPEGGPELGRIGEGLQEGTRTRSQ